MGPPNTEELGLMDEDNNYTEGEGDLEMEANDIELPSPDLVELASMLDEDSNNNTEGQDLMMKMMIIKIIKNHLQRMREIKRQEGKFKIIKLLKKGLERNQKRMKSVKIKYKKKKKKKRWSPQNPKED